MPWHSEESDQCPLDEPWAVIMDSDGSVVACHVSKEEAESQIVALYANENGGKMLNKTRSAEFKALVEDGVPEGTFSAVVAVYGNVDKAGDRIMDDAFDDSLDNWRKSGDPIPIVLAHEWQDPFAHIGYVMPDKVKSVPGVGLIVEEGRLDIQDNPAAAQVFKLMKRRTLKEFSFGYNVPDGGQKKAQDGAFNLSKINLIELGPCLKGVNDRTQLLAVKAALSGAPTLEDRVEALEAKVWYNTPTDDLGKSLEVDLPPEVVEMEEDEEYEYKGNLESQMAALTYESQIASVEHDLNVKDVLAKGDSQVDAFNKQLDEIENSLS